MPQGKPSRPTDEQLLKDYEEYGNYREIAKKHKVASSTASKWLKPLRESGKIPYHKWGKDMPTLTDYLCYMRKCRTLHDLSVLLNLSPNKIYDYNKKHDIESKKYLGTNVGIDMDDPVNKFIYGVAA